MPTARISLTHRDTMDSFDTIARYLPVEIRSPKGGGGHGGHGSSGGSSGGSSKGSSGSSSSGSSSKGSSGSSGSSGSGGKTVIVSTSTYHYGYGSTGFLGLPLWASILICVGSFLVLLFFIALIWSSVIGQFCSLKPPAPRSSYGSIQTYANIVNCRERT